MTIGAQSGPPRASRRALRGACEGAAWGFGIGLVRVVAAGWRGKLAGWSEPLIFLALAAGVGALICAVGRGIAGRLTGAVLGATVGLFAGLGVGAATGYYTWEVLEDRTRIGYPVGQLAGTGTGLVIGSAVGAWVERVVRDRRARRRT